MMGCAFTGNQSLIQHSLEVTSQTTSIHIRADTFEVLNGEFAILKHVPKSFALPFIQDVFLHQYIPANNLFTTLLDLYHLGFEAGYEVVEPAGHVHAVFTDALDLIVKGWSITVIVFADGEKPLEVITGPVEEEGRTKGDVGSKTI